MRRVVFLFVGILSSVRAIPFDIDSIDLPNPFPYNLRVDKGEFGNYAFPENSKHEDEIVTFKSSQNSKRLHPSDEGKMKGLQSLFGDLKDCDIITMTKPPKEGCIYIANGDVYFIEVLSEVDIEDVYIAFEEADVGKCKVGEDGFDDVPEESCFRINEGSKSVYWIGVYDDNGFYQSDKVDDIKGLFGYVEKCDLSSVSGVPKEGCSLFDEDGIHYVSVLHRENIDDVIKALSKLNIPECVYDDKLGIITEEPCYLYIAFFNILHFLNLHGEPEVVRDNDNDDHYSEETYEIADAEVSTLSLVQLAIENGNLHQLTLKGRFNQQPAKAVLPKKIQSIQELQEVEKRFGRQGSQHGNHRPQWMK